MTEDTHELGNSPRSKAVEITARALEEEDRRPLGWTPEQFELWWTKDPRNHFHGKRREQAAAVLDALQAAGLLDLPAETPTPAPTK